MKWIVLSLTWSLGDVRAVLTFAINILCAIGIWVFGYSTWRWRARKVTQSSTVPLHSLISINGIGEAVEALLVLERKCLIIPRFHFVLVQFTVVTVLTATAVLSGPIAKFATRNSSVVREIPVPGLLATTNHTSQIEAQVKWNETFDRLKTAQFPPNQLLDYLPDNKVNWLYEETQWNSTWSLSCEHSPLTAVGLTATGDTGDHNFEELRGLRSIFPMDIVSNWSKYRHLLGWRAFRQDAFFQDVLMILVVSTNTSANATDYAGIDADNATLRMIFVALHMHNVPTPVADSTDSYFGVGSIERSAYTMADCTVSRNPYVMVNDTFHYAFPWTDDTKSIVNAFSAFYGANFVEESIAQVEIFHPSPEDLIRFLQAYMISKDTQYRHSATRKMSANVRSVEISAAALAILLLYSLLIIFTLFWAVVFQSKRGKLNIPRTKIEWVMQAMWEAYGRNGDGTVSGESWWELRKELRKALFGNVVNHPERGRGGIIREAVSEGRKEQ